MMRYIIMCFFTCACFKLQAQVNFVLNPSFEQYSQCPDNYDQIKYANYWNGIDTTWDPKDSATAYLYCLPDYCNACSWNPKSIVPNNLGFFQYPRTGQGMSQVIMFFDESYTFPGKRDYLQGRLSTHLIAGKSYCISFYVNYEGVTTLLSSSGFAVDHIGAYLDDGSIDADTGSTCGIPHPSIIPQIYTTTIITDTLNWTKIQGSFVANGTEKFITIGNFFDNAHTNYIAYPSSPARDFSIYLVDDVSVIESNAVANAGPDRLVSPGSDSAYIGTHDEGMPCTWYIKGNAAPIGYSGGFKVHPAATTTYIVEMDLCGNITYDTVVVWVAPAGVASPGLSTGGEVTVSVYPNPARVEVTIEGEEGSEVRIFNLLGQVVVPFDKLRVTNPFDKLRVTGGKETLNIRSLNPGVYIVNIKSSSGGIRNVRLVKE